MKPVILNNYFIDFMWRIIFLCSFLNILILVHFSFAENSLKPAARTLKLAQVGAAYFQRIRVIGETKNRKVTSCVGEGYLPDGLIFHNGLISGVPTRVERCSLCVRAGSRRHNNYLRKAYTLIVDGNNPFEITTQVLSQATPTENGEMSLTVTHSGAGIPIKQISVSLLPLGCKKTTGGSSLLSYTPPTPIAIGDSYTDTFEFPDLSQGACISILVEASDGNGNRTDCKSIVKKTITQSDLD